MPTRFRRGDLLSVPSGTICHQCNCLTKRGKGLSDAVFRKFPWANLYDRRQGPSIPGTVVQDKHDQLTICHLVAQRYPGRSRYSNDTSAMRLEWFRACLHVVAADDSIREVHFPQKIGCGLAGGDWEAYFYEINNILADKDVTIWKKD